MDLYPEDFKEQLDEALEFAKYLKEKYNIEFKDKPTWNF